MNEQQKQYLLKNSGKLSTKQLAKELGLKTHEVIAFLSLQKKASPSSQEKTGSMSVPKSWFVKALLILSILGTLIYSNTFRAEFQFDDGHVIVENAAIRNFRNIAGIWEQAPARFLTNLSFALNYHLGGYDVFSYHLVNLMIHVAGAFLTLLLVWLIFQTPTMRGRFPKTQSFTLALFSGLIFLCHPIQTQAVTYIVQRLASLATLFYLASVVSYIKSRLSGSLKFYILSIVLAAAGMLTKEIDFTLPLMISGVEFIFFDNHGTNLSRRFVHLLPILSTLAIIPAVYRGGHSVYLQAIKTILPSETRLISRMDYLCTQFNVIRTYIRLLFFPAGQSFYHDYRVAHGLWEARTLASLFFLGAILLTGFHLRKRQRLISFGIFWFFLTLSIESGLIPISDVIFEHRLYLPMAGFAMIVSAAAVLAFRSTKQTAIFLTMIVIALSILTYQRNFVWQSKLSLWNDVVKKSPRKADAHVSLGFAYSELGDYKNAIIHYRKALNLGLVKATLYDGLAFALENTGDIKQATDFYQKAVAFDPSDAEAHNNLGSIYANYGRHDEGILEMLEALKQNPYYLQAYLNLGNVYALEERYDDATAILQKALAIDPAFKPAITLLSRIEKSKAAARQKREKE